MTPCEGIRRLWPVRTFLGCLLLIAVVPGLGMGCTAPETSPAQVTPAPPIATVPAALVNPTVEPAAKAMRGTRTPIPAAAPSPQLLPTSTPIAPGDATPTVFPTATPPPTSAVISLSLQLLAPMEGAGVDVGAVRVLGITSPDAAVTVNGMETEVEPDGAFQHDLILKDGINSLEATATQPSGATASDSVVVLFVPRSSGIPLSVLFPQGLEVSQPKITIIGATRQDAVVGINGVPVDVNKLGIFSTEVPLELGANLIEVVAVDLDENVNFQTVVVFYIPEGS